MASLMPPPPPRGHLPPAGGMHRPESRSTSSDSNGGGARGGGISPSWVSVSGSGGHGSSGGIAGFVNHVGSGPTTSTGVVTSPATPTAASGISSSVTPASPANYYEYPEMKFLLHMTMAPVCGICAEPIAVHERVIACKSILPPESKREPCFRCIRLSATWLNQGVHPRTTTTILTTPSSSTRQ